MSVDPSNPSSRGHSPLRGRPFEKGNGGRKPGSKNRTTLIADALLKGEEGELVRKGIELAKAGDVPMLKFLLERILPKERSVRVELPDLVSSSDAIEAMAVLVEAASSGQISPSEAAALTGPITAYARIVDAAEVEERLEKLEKILARIGLEKGNGEKTTAPH